MADDDPTVFDENAAEHAAPTEATLQAIWDAASDDPDPFDDLEYELVELNVLATSTSEEKVVMLPENEAGIRDEEYVIAEADLTVDPLDML